MAEPVPISDPADPRVADYVGLTDADLRRRHEATAGVFIVESETALRVALELRWPLRSVLVSAKRHERLAEALSRLPPDVAVYVADQAVLDAVAGFPIHRGAVAAAVRCERPTVGRLLAGAGPLVAVLEGINDTENLGSLFRNAAALGASAIVLDPTCADPFSRRAVRVSVGNVLRLPFARAERWPDALQEVRDGGYRLVALTPDPTAEPIDVVAADRPARVAVLLGAEGPGLSPVAVAAADRRVRIPMAAGVDSLNVATAAAIAFHRLSVNLRPG